MLLPFVLPRPFLLTSAQGLNEVSFRCPSSFRPPSPRLPFAVFSAGDSFGYFCFSRIFCYTSCPSVIPNSGQEVLQLHQPVFHTFANVFLEEHRRSHGLHNCRTFFNKPFLLGFRSNCRQYSHSAYTRSHLVSLNSFHCTSFHDKRNAWYGLGFRLRCSCHIILRAFFSVCVSRYLIGYFSPCCVFRRVLGRESHFCGAHRRIHFYYLLIYIFFIQYLS